MRRVPIYKSEIDDKIADTIRSTASIAYAAQLFVLPNEFIFPDHKTKAEQLARATNEGQIDLFYMKSVLATIGWNKNDDVLDKLEVWMARATPEDKPLNYQHNPRDIIGHITGNYVADFDNKIIHDDTAIDDLPEQFHVFNSEVLYKYWPEKDLIQRMQGIIAEILDGKLFVSMEALFDNFDYAVIGSNGGHHIIKRNEESAFLSKHLRAYGGDGIFDGNKLGRLLRNIIFSGKGIVHRPANPHSIIFESVNAFERANASSVKDFRKDIIITGYKLDDRTNTTGKESMMAGETVTQVDLLQNENKRLEQSLNAAVAAQKDAEKRLTEMNEQTVKAKMEALVQDVKVRDEKITSLTNQVQVEQKTRTDAESKVKELDTKVSELTTQVNKLTSDTQKSKRIGVIATELVMAPDAALKLYDDVVASLNLSDDSFNKFVDNIKTNMSKKSTDTVKNDQTIATDTQKALENANKDSKNPPLGVNGTVEQTRAGLSTFLAKSCLGKKVEAN